MQRSQKTVTLSKEQIAFANANYGKMNNAQLAKMLGLTYIKTIRNLKVMGLHIPKPDEGIVVEMGKIFDVDKFKKYYDY